MPYRQMCQTLSSPPSASLAPFDGPPFLLIETSVSAAYLLPGHREDWVVTYHWIQVELYGVDQHFVMWGNGGLEHFETRELGEKVLYSYLSLIC